MVAVPEPQALDKGLIFVKDTDILLSGDKWTIAINIAIDDYAALVDITKMTLTQIRHKIQVHKNPHLDSFDIYWEEINRLDTMVRELDVDLQGFRKLLFEKTSNSGPQMKRGLMNVQGYGLKYLFGTVDARDVQRLTTVCNKLHTLESKMMHAVEHQLSYIQTLDAIARQNAQDRAELAGTLHDSIRNFSLQLNRVETDLLDTQEALERQAQYSAVIQEIEMAILELKFSIVQLQESLDVTSLGQLSSVLINLYNLSVILQ